MKFNAFKIQKILVKLMCLSLYLYFFQSVSTFICFHSTLVFAAKFGRDRSIESYQELQSSIEMAQAIADIKFTYVVSCQVYGMQKTSKDLKDKSCYVNILNLMIMYRS